MSDNHSHNIDEFAEVYFNENPFSNEVDMRSAFLAEKLPSIVEGKDVLDLGIGHAKFFEAVSSNARVHDVVEGSKLVIDAFLRERSVTSNVSITHSDFESFKTDKDYDVILAISMLMYLEDPVTVVKRYTTFLRPGKKMIISVPNAQSLHRQIGHAMGILSDMQHLEKYHINRGHRQFFTLESISEVVHEAGLIIDKVEGIFLKPITTRQMQQLSFGPAHYAALLQLGVDYPELCNHIYLECTKAS